MVIYFLFYHVNTSQFMRWKWITKKNWFKKFFLLKPSLGTPAIHGLPFCLRKPCLIPAWMIFLLVILYSGNVMIQTTHYIKIQSRSCNDVLHIKQLLSHETITAYMFSKWMILSPKILKKIKCCDCNGNWTHNHLVCKQALSHLAKLAKWLSCIVRTYLYGAFDCMSRNSLLENSGNYRV